MSRSLLASSVATVVSAPLVAYAFGRISLIAPLTNLISDPIIALAQPLLFLALVTAPLPSVAVFIADAAHPLLAAFDLVATMGDSIPHATIAVVPTRLAAALAGLSAAATVVACVSRFPARPTLIALVTLAALPWVA
jgi:competence protein ComEC